MFSHLSVVSQTTDKTTEYNITAMYTKYACVQKGSKYVTRQEGNKVTSCKSDISVDII